MAGLEKRPNKELWTSFDIKVKTRKTLFLIRLSDQDEREREREGDRREEKLGIVGPKGCSENSDGRTRFEAALQELN